MSSTDRQNRLLLAEDWKKIYQTFKYADFKSYDFDNLRRTMIEYLRTNYPEDFNDYIESSEYLALIDMIAFLGQNISFRIDLNARENFLELAERRESILRLARLLSYNPRRNQTANGLLKFSSVRTTEQVVDSNGINLSNKTIVWNDSTNSDWYEHFTKILNAALPVQNTFGRPVKSESVSGIATEQYNFNNLTNTLPIYTFTKAVNNRSLNFEVVSSTIENSSIIESAPLPSGSFSFLYRDNGQGPASNSTGFFAHFRQGSLQRSDFIIDSPIPNQQIDINAENINNTDIWLYKLDTNGNEVALWTKVDAVEGNNIVYNSLNKKLRNVYSVLTRVQDRISLIFSDGIFGDLPKGNFRVYYRTSVNANYSILPQSLTNVTVKIPYINRVGNQETLTITLDLKTVIDNATSTESNDSIKLNAPATYYTQNRLITGEDYNVGPLSVSQDIIKVKSVNRTSSGISRYYDILDATGKYSTTNLFGTDGVIFKEKVDKKTNVKFITRTDIEGLIENTISNILDDNNLRHFYYQEFPNQNYTEINLIWNLISTDTNRSTGFIQDSNGIVYTVGSFTESPLRYFEPNAMVKFIPPTGFYFFKNTLTTNGNQLGATSYKWVKVVTISENGTQITDTNLGPIVLNDIVPNGSRLIEVKPKFVRDIISDVKSQIVDNMFAYRTFGLRYNREERQWRVISQENLNIISPFSLTLTGDATGQQLDSSWLLLFETDGFTYNITYRTLRYIFESDQEIRFYFDSNKKIYDSKTGKIIRDKISVLNVNNNINVGNGTNAFTVDFNWEISKEYRDKSGYIDSKKVEISFFDSDDDGVVDDPQIFNEIVNQSNYIFTKNVVIENTDFEIYIDAATENIQTINIGQFPSTTAENNPIYYIVTDDIFKQLDSSNGQLSMVYNYNAYVGRDKLKFHYIHAGDENTRIDPSSSNIIDVYLLTQQYDTRFRQYIDNVIPTKPLPPSNDQLFLSYASEINKIKSISDEIIYHPVKYKILFGNKADFDLQAVFKVVKNPERVKNDNDIKSRVISAINKFFALDNWDFGETFYWSELEAYIMKDLSPDLSSIVIVPRSSTSYFGSLFEIRAESDEIFISAATVDDVEIISGITADRLRAEGAIVTSTSSSTAIQSSSEVISTTTGGFIF